MVAVFVSIETYPNPVLAFWITFTGRGVQSVSVKHGARFARDKVEGKTKHPVSGSINLSL